MIAALRADSTVEVLARRACGGGEEEMLADDEEEWREKRFMRKLKIMLTSISRSQ
jgi:hypothetical protein